MHPNFDSMESGPQEKPYLRDEVVHMREEFLAELTEKRTDPQANIEKKQAFLDRLKHEKERFQSIFTTERGSTYFAMKDGSSLRFKKSEEGFEVKPLMEHLIFVDEETAKDLMAEIKRIGSFGLAELVGRPIPTTSMQVGAVPVELGYGQRVALEREGDIVKILGTEYVNNGSEPFEAYDGKAYRDIGPGETFVDPGSIAGLHVGHAIVSIE